MAAKSAVRRLCPLASMSEATVKPSGNLVQNNRQKNHAAQPAGNQKPGGNRHAVKKSVNGEPEQCGNSGVLRHKMLDVRFFSEMEMRRERVLKKMNDEISDQHEEIREASRQGHRLGENLENGRGQHEARAERQKIFQVLARPFAVQDKKSAENVGRRGRQPEQQRQEHARSGDGDGRDIKHLRCDGTPRVAQETGIFVGHGFTA